MLTFRWDYTCILLCISELLNFSRRKGIVYLASLLLAFKQLFSRCFKSFGVTATSDSSGGVKSEEGRGLF